jgi:hypothetical protein
MGLVSGIRDPEKIIPDPGSKRKRHRIPDPQHCLCVCRQFKDFLEMFGFKSQSYPLHDYLSTTYPLIYLQSMVTHHCCIASFLANVCMIYLQSSLHFYCVLYNKVRGPAVGAEADGSQLGVSGQTAGETARRSAGQFKPVPVQLKPVSAQPNRISSS